MTCRVLLQARPSDAYRLHVYRLVQQAPELEAMRSQTVALGSLPEILPPKGDWRVLEAQLRSEGLVSDPSIVQRLGLARTPGWMKAAAAVMLFLSGAGTGVAMTTIDTTTSGDMVVAGDLSNVEDAAFAVRSAEEDYVTAVARYRRLLANDGRGEISTDPVGRYAALEHLVMVSQAAVRQAPGDPFFNGFLASAMAQRDAAAQMVSNKRDRWF